MSRLLVALIVVLFVVYASKQSVKEKIIGFMIFFIFISVLTISDYYSLFFIIISGVALHLMILHAVEEDKDA